jgi:hypothetical protein
MEPHVRWSRPLIGLGLIISTTILVACSGTGAGASAAAQSTAEPSMGVAEATSIASEGAAASEGVPGGAEWDLNLVPAASFDPSKVSVACDEATMGTSAQMSCDDVVKLTVGVAQTLSHSPVQQIHVTKPADDPNKIQATFWVAAEEGSGVEAFTWVIDPVNKTFTPPQSDPEAVFPTAS